MSRILTPEGLFDETAYKAYSPAYLGAGNIVVYTGFFALYTSTITYAFLYHRHEIVRGFRSILARQTQDGKDIHMRLMRAYPEAPEWWYMVLLVIVRWPFHVSFWWIPSNVFARPQHWVLLVSLLSRRTPGMKLHDCNVSDRYQMC